MSTLLTEALHSGWLGKAAEPARWLIVVGIAYTLATLVVYFVADPAHASVPATQTEQPDANAAALGFDLNTVRSRHLFGEAGAVVDAAPADEPVVETRLPLELHGVFVAERPEESAAIVAQKNKQGKLYNIDDTVPGNAALVEVHGDHVVLRRAGIKETLRFFASEGGFTAQSQTKPQPAAPKSNPRTGQQVVTRPAEQPRTPREFVETYRERMQEAPAEVLEELGLSPVSENGSDGYRLDNLANSPYLNRTGLQPGDVVVSVNGRPVGNVSSDQLELDSLLTQGSARLEVQRGSRRFYVTASLK